MTKCVTHTYRVDGEVLRFIAASRNLAVQLAEEPLDASFTLWKDGRAALGALATRASAP